MTYYLLVSFLLSFFYFLVPLVLCAHRFSLSPTLAEPYQSRIFGGLIGSDNGRRQFRGPVRKKGCLCENWANSLPSMCGHG